jgi:alkanesulfonate monooxygenase SsuD/methylene tetrahydromethanopterin reductase-like flavin-dependent oxidoreductase (luciferase family)
VIFGVVGSPAEGKAFYADIKARITPCGRDPDHLKILPAAFVVVGETMAEVEASRERLDATSKSRMAGANGAQKLAAGTIVHDTTAKRLRGSGARLTASLQIVMSWKFRA